LRFKTNVFPVFKQEFYSLCHEKMRKGFTYTVFIMDELHGSFKRAMCKKSRFLVYQLVWFSAGKHTVLWQ